MFLDLLFTYFNQLKYQIFFKLLQYRVIVRLVKSYFRFDITLEKTKNFTLRFLIDLLAVTPSP